MNNPGLWVLGILIALFLMLHPDGRRFGAAVLGIALLVACAFLFTRRADCPPAGPVASGAPTPKRVATAPAPSGLPCEVLLAPTWAGACLPSPGAAVVEQAGYYVLVGPLGSSAMCVDLRFWGP